MRPPAPSRRRGGGRRRAPLAVLALCLAASFPGNAREGAPSDPTPIADVHLHYNWDQKEIIGAAEAVRRLRANGVRLGVVSSTPTELALELSAAGEGLVIPFFSPYLTHEHRGTWHRDPRVLEQAAQGLASGAYRGIGELHLWGGMAPARDNPILVGLLRLAERHDVPFLLHTEASSTRLFQAVCEAWPRVRFLWAHAGGQHPPRALAPVLERCPNAWLDLSVRDPWRYDTLAPEDGAISQEWVALLSAYPERFMIGSDPVWSVTRGQRWDLPDEGWDHLGRLLDYHRRWLARLPPAVARAIALTNALRFFGRE